MRIKSIHAFPRSTAIAALRLMLDLDGFCIRFSEIRMRGLVTKLIRGVILMQLIDGVRTRQHLDEIEFLSSSRYLAMERLCEALAIGQGRGPLSNMAHDERDALTDEASFMCDLWERDTNVRDELSRRSATIHQLLAEQSAIARRIASAEAMMVASLGDA